jgi:hypothetical protein
MKRGVNVRTKRWSYLHRARKYRRKAQAALKLSRRIPLYDHQLKAMTGYMDLDDGEAYRLINLTIAYERMARGQPRVSELEIIQAQSRLHRKGDRPFNYYFVGTTLWKGDRVHGLVERKARGEKLFESITWPVK